SSRIAPCGVLRSAVHPSSQSVAPPLAMGYPLRFAAISGLAGHADPGSPPRREPTSRSRPSPQGSRASRDGDPLGSAARASGPAAAGRPRGASGLLTSSPLIRGSGGDPRQGVSRSIMARSNSPKSPFRDRHEAGRHLARALAAYAGRRDVLVLALPRGG